MGEPWGEGEWEVKVKKQEKPPEPDKAWFFVVLALFMFGCMLSFLLGAL